MAKKCLRLSLTIACIFSFSNFSYSETLLGALEKAYRNNHGLNSDRVSARIADENVALAKSGYRPSIRIVGSYSASDRQSRGSSATVGTIGIKLDQRIFDGFATKNSVASATMQAHSQHAFVRNSEQNLLLQTVQIYADVYAARRIAAYRQETLAALEEQVRVDRARLEVGEGTRTDLAQSEAQRSQSISLLSQARADLQTKEAMYYQIVGASPERLQAPTPVRNLPVSQDKSLALALSQHPAVISSQYAAKAAAYTVRVKEGAFLPKVGLVADSSYNEIYSGSVAAAGASGGSHSIGLQLDLPIYQGGAMSADIRQSKEKFGQAQIQLDMVREQVREQLVAAWSQREGAKSAVKAYSDSVKAGKIALDGRIQENLVGQATTLDVLNSRTMLVDSQINLVLAERDMIVSGYAVKVALGQLTMQNLGIQAEYNPKIHYDTVKNKWLGTAVKK